MAATKRLRIAGINLERDHPASEARQDLIKIIDLWHPHIIGCQEAKQFITAMQNIPGYQLALPKSARGDECNNPILYDVAALRLTQVRIIPIHPGKAHQYPARNINQARFDLLWDGSELWDHNTHVNSHIEAGGHARALPRTPLATHNFVDLADRTRRHSRGRALSFCQGDFNVDEDADNRVDFSGFPNEIFREHGIQSIYDALHTPASFDTKGNRKIDCVAHSRRDGRVRARDVKRECDLFTDHCAICAFYDVRLLP